MGAGRGVMANERGPPPLVAAEACACRDTDGPREIALWTVRFCYYPKKKVFIYFVHACRACATMGVWKSEAAVGT